eukprot:TRINITY_DN6280_c0_g1_i1.p1 TRINITY_DN6280_c0_g1~~TRINITY_DN6280_c0_g1_i1.p1  ORF type:complete len:197 (+),score=30.95 TRINITY_DN6280_c0_g1_i1:24-593(+)
MADFVYFYDSHSNMRSVIETDGSVKDLAGALIGFINNDGTCGNKDNVFLGEINDDGQVINSKDEVIGRVDFGNGDLKQADGSHFGSIDTSGCIYDKADASVAKIDNFSFHNIKQIAAYIFFFDQKMIDDSKSTLLLFHKPNGENPDTHSCGCKHCQTKIQSLEDEVKHLNQKLKFLETWLKQLDQSING